MQRKKCLKFQNRLPLIHQRVESTNKNTVKHLKMVSKEFPARGRAPWVSVNWKAVLLPRHWSRLGMLPSTFACRWKSAFMEQNLNRCNKQFPTYVSLKSLQRYNGGHYSLCLKTSAITQDLPALAVLQIRTKRNFPAQNVHNPRPCCTLLNQLTTWSHTATMKNRLLYELI